MKKIFSAILAVMMITVMAHAPGNTPAKKTEVKATSKTVKAEASPQATKTTVAKTATVKASSGAKVKADGTPDMRYGANKTANATAGPKKADGTPDLRYKSNKTATAKTEKKAATTK